MKKKLTLKKSTIANLSRLEQQNVKGGDLTDSICGSDEFCGSLPNTFFCPTRPAATCAHCLTIEFNC